MQTITSKVGCIARSVFTGVYNLSLIGGDTQTFVTSCSVGTRKVRPSEPRSGTAAEDPQALLSAWSGFPKDFSRVAIKKGLIGDDAFFIGRYKAIDVFGVADGVGGWRTYGVDPSHFSGMLMQTCERLVNLGRFNPQKPASIIAGSYYELFENRQQIIGSSTACVVALNRAEGIVYTANIGDSGFLVVRSGKIVHRSSEQTHYFNTPFQLSCVPPAQREHVLSDSPESADTTEFVVRNGDLIVVATDGLFDNMPDKDIVAELSKIKEVTSESIQWAANSIAMQARRHAFDSQYMSPFARRAGENGIQTIGGKPDDITVLLASVAL